MATRGPWLPHFQINQDKSMCCSGPALLQHSYYAVFGRGDCGHSPNRSESRVLDFQVHSKLQRKWAQSSSCQLSHGFFGRSHSKSFTCDSRKIKLARHHDVFFSARMASHESFATMFSVTLFLLDHVFSAHWQDVLKLFQMSFRSLKSISIFFSLGFSGSCNRLQQAVINENNQLRPRCPFQVSPRGLSRQRQRHP